MLAILAEAKRVATTSARLVMMAMIVVKWRFGEEPGGKYVYDYETRASTRKLHFPSLIPNVDRHTLCGPTNCMYAMLAPPILEMGAASVSLLAFGQGAHARVVDDFPMSKPMKIRSQRWRIGAAKSSRISFALFMYMFPCRCGRNITRRDSFAP